MSFQAFLSISIGVVISVAGMVFTLFTSNNRSHGKMWDKMNEYHNENTNRLTAVETEIKNIKKNGGK